MRHSWTFSLLLVALFYCSPKEENSQVEIKPNEISLVAEDSTVVKDILASTFIFQDGDKDHLIFRDAPASTIYVFDRETGDLVNKWTKTGDVPGAFSMAVSNLDISDSGELVLLDPNQGLLIFTKDGGLIKRASPVANQWSFGGAFNLFRVNELVTIQEEKFNLYSLDKLEAEQDYTAEYLKNRKNLVLTNLETGEHRLILPFPEGSKFLSGKVFPFEDFRPRFVVDEAANKLFVVFQNEPVLYTYAWNDGEPQLESSKRIELPGFEENKGWEVGQIQMAQITDQTTEPFPARIQALEAVENGFLLSYSTRPLDKDNYTRYINKEATADGFKQIIAETRPKTVFLDSEANVFPVDFPPMHYESFQIIEDKIHWMKKPNPGEEAEEFTVYWGALKFD